MAVPKEAIARPSATASAVRSSRILSEDCCMGPPIILRNNPGDDRLFRWRDKRGWPINSRNPRGWYTFVLNERPSLHSPPRVADRRAGGPEREGLAPLAVLIDTPPTLDGGAAVAFDRETELA